MSVGIFLTKDGAIKAMNVTGWKHTEPLYCTDCTIQFSPLWNWTRMRIVTLLALCALLCCSQGQMQEECLNESIPLHMINEMINTSKFIQKTLDVSILIHKVTICVFKRVTCITNVLLLLQRDNKPFHRILGQLKNCYKVR